MPNPYQTPSSAGDLRHLTELPANCQQMVRVGQIITVAMFTGVAAFLAFLLWQNKAAINGAPEILNWLGLGMAGMMIAMHYVVPNISASSAIKNLSKNTADNSPTIEGWVGIFNSRLIIAVALLEGAAFMNLVGYMTSPFVGNLIATAVLMSFILIRFPTSNGVLNWIQSQSG